MSITLQSTYHSKSTDALEEYLADSYRSAKDGDIEADRGRL